MPKRSYDILADMSTDPRLPPVKAQKTERTHEENQERAYIAASRRADRSLEARVQSAKMASDIHRKRTGRGLKVSEEIVLKEEMYEEMEDDMPRAYKSLAAHLQTESPELNHRVTAYIAGQTAMATMAKYNEINKVFNAAFPRAASFSQSGTQNSAYMSPLVNSHRLSLPHSEASPSSLSRNQSMSNESHYSTADNSMPTPGRTPSSVSIATPDLSPVITSTDMTELVGTPYHMPQSPYPHLALDPQLAQQPTSSFTSELPNEVKMMANIDMNDPMAMHFFGDGVSSGFNMPNEYAQIMRSPHSHQFNPDAQDCQPDEQDCHPDFTNDYYEPFYSPFESPLDFTEGHSSNNIAHFGTPGGAGDTWESFVDFGADQ